jgi:hypothetical protein
VAFPVLAVREMSFTVITACPLHLVQLNQVYSIAMIRHVPDPHESTSNLYLQFTVSLCVLSRERIVRPKHQRVCVLMQPEQNDTASMHLLRPPSIWDCIPDIATLHTTTLEGWRTSFGWHVPSQHSPESCSRPTQRKKKGKGEV